MPGEFERVGDLEVAQDLGFQERMWKLQRVAWVVAVLVVAATLTGLFGDGPLARAHARSPDGSLELVYERFERHRSPSEISIYVSRSLARDGTIEIWLDREWVDGFEIRGTYPEPESAATSTERLTYTFTVEPLGDRVEIALQTLADATGFRRGVAGVNGGPTVSFWQLIYP